MREKTNKMKRTMQRLSALAVALVAAACAAMPVLAAPAIDTSKAVIDEADILSDETEAYVTEISVALQESCGAQIGVYTVEYIGNNTMEGYAYEVANAWGLGDADKDNGVLLLLASGEDDYYLTRGTGLESQLSVTALGDILDDNLEEDWVKKDYDSGTKKTVDALAARLESIYGVDLDTVAADEINTVPKKGVGILQAFAVILIVLIVIIINSMMRPRGPRGPRGGYYGGFGGPRVRRTPPPPRRTPPPPRRNPPRGGMGGPRPGGMGGSRPSGPRPGGSFRSGGGSFRGGGAGRR